MGECFKPNAGRPNNQLGLVRSVSGSLCTPYSYTLFLIFMDVFFYQSLHIEKCFRPNLGRPDTWAYSLDKWK